jgi:glycosidase
MKPILIQIVALIVISTCIIFFSCTKKKQIAHAPSQTEVKNPEWVKNAVIYEVNIRQYSKEGTFTALEKDLPRIKELGVDIVWLMPIFPIGETNRKISQTKLIEEVKNPAERKKYLGSYYSIKDYYTVNSDYGKIEDFQSLVKRIHELGMYVILDIAINHTAWDNKWITTHPDFYIRVKPGTIPWNKKWMKEHPEYFKRIQRLGMTYPINPTEFDWWDVADLNFENEDLRKEMVNVFNYWVSKYDIDGFRCDYAAGVPTDFWNELRPALEKVKPVFMLAEADMPEHHLKAFDMSYDWKFHHIMNQIAIGKKTANAIEKHFAWVDSSYAVGSILMEFTSNHDENSWNGTEFERLDGGAQTFAVLAATVPGMLLVYNGQEAAFNHRLKFFEKDSISWNIYEYTEFYKNLIKLKKENKALWNGINGGSFKRIETTDNNNIFAFIREKDENSIVIILNLTKKQRTFAIRNNIADGMYTNALNGATFELKKNLKLVFTPWQYSILVKK